MSRTQEIADEMEAQLDDVSIRKVVETTQEIQATVGLANPEWGLPGEVYRFKEERSLEIVDFSHVSEDGLTVVFSR